MLSEFERDELAEGIPQACLECGWLSEKTRMCRLRECSRRR
jgi:hypothetical protein